MSQSLHYRVMMAKVIWKNFVKNLADQIFSCLMLEFIVVINISCSLLLPDFPRAWAAICNLVKP